MENNRNTYRQQAVLKPGYTKQDTGPDAIAGSIRNYDDDFLRAHASKSDDLIFEELLYYINYKKKRGDFISYDEKIQIDRYCDHLLKQLKVNRLYREEMGYVDSEGYKNIPQEFYDMVNNDALPMINLYHRDTALNSYQKINIRIPKDKMDEFKALKYENPDAKTKVSGDCLFTIDIESHNKNNNNEQNNKNLSKKELKKLNKQNSNNPTINQSKPAVPNIPGRPAVPQNGAPNIPGKPMNGPSVPNKPSIPSIPSTQPSAQKPKGMFDL